MIDIRYIRTEAMHSLSITGHADYAEHGNNIVCAGVSAVTYALVGYLINYTKETEHHIKLESGLGTIMCYRNDNTDTAFDVAEIGYRLISHNYPNEVIVHISAASGC